MTAVPVRRLPQGPVTTVLTQKGALIAVALPRQEASTGLVWRLARAVDSSIVRQRSEAEVGPSVVVLFEVVGTGEASVAFALTRGESSPDALQALTYSVRAAATSG